MSASDLDDSSRKVLYSSKLKGWEDASRIVQVEEEPRPDPHRGAGCEEGALSQAEARTNQWDGDLGREP